MKTHYFLILPGNNSYLVGQQFYELPDWEEVKNLIQVIYID
jgi:hypothetical protein